MALAPTGGVAIIQSMTTTSMAVQALSDSPPTHQQLIDSLGPRAAQWSRLEEFVSQRYGLEGVLIRDGTDWIVRYRRSGKSLFTLLPRPDGFRALVVMGPSTWGAVAGAELSVQTQEKWRSARPYPDGRWLWLDVTDDDVVDDIEQLVMLKSPPPRRRR